MSFIQNLFTSRDNNANAETYVGQQDRLWYSPNTNAIYVNSANVAGGTMNKLFWLSLWLLSTVLIAELCVLWLGIPHGVPEIIVGRVLGMLDGVAMQVMNFWYGTSHGSSEKTALLAAK